MHLVYCSPLLSYPGGHFVRFTIERALSMQKAGINLVVVGFPPSAPSEISKANLAYVSVSDQLRPLHRRFANKMAELFGNAWICSIEHMCVLWHALRYARKFNVPLVYIADIEPWIIGVLALLGQIRRYPRIVGMIIAPFYTKGVKSKRISLLFRSYLNRICSSWLPRLIDVVCDDEFIAKDMYKSLKNVHIVSDGFVNVKHPMPMADARRKLGLPLGQRMILLFGMGTHGRGADILAKALRQIAPVFFVCVIGRIALLFKDAFFADGDRNASAWIGNLRVVDGFVSENERELYYQACDAVVLPHRYGHSCSSGNLRDAISYGKAIIVSDQFYMGHMVKSNALGLTFPPENIEKLKECLLVVARMPDQWFVDIARRSKMVVESNSSDEVGVRYRELFKEVVGRN